MIADLSGALIWPKKRTVVVSDLHLAKGTSFASRGIFLPPYDSIETLSVLNRVLTHYSPNRVICLGDSFHDNEATKQRLIKSKFDSISEGYNLSAPNKKGQKWMIYPVYENLSTPWNEVEY